MEFGAECTYKSVKHPVLILHLRVVAGVQNTVDNSAQLIDPTCNGAKTLKWKS